ncbi:unnamed protein product [Withania somnifera]
MGTQKVLLFLFLHIHLHCFILAQIPKLEYASCGNNGNYTENSTYKNNLNTLLTSLSSRLDNYGFYYDSIGQNTDKVSGIVLCRGDVELEQCRTCVNNVAQKIVQVCPNQNEAVGGYGECSLQYSNRSIIDDTKSFSILYYFWNTMNASEPMKFNQELKKLLDDLRDRAAKGGPFRKYASGNVTGPDFQNIYALVQCNPNLSPTNCINCLTEAYGSMPNCPCNGKKGGRIIGPLCNFRYETDQFFHVAFDSPPPAGNDDKTPPAGNANKKVPAGNDNKIAPVVKDNKKARTIIIIIMPTVTVIILTVWISAILMKKRKRKLVDNIQSTLGYDISEVESLQYDFPTIRAATDNFSNANKLGQGGFGPVYKGKLPNGQEIAVKRLSADSGQGDVEFKNEVLLVARLQHRNLVRLLGFSLYGTERLLVYEFVPNASLDQFLFDRAKRGQLDWEKRSKIIGGIARGILYLHEDSRLRIIHRDLKASNVLLDVEMNPKIADFGMARLVTLDETQGNTNRIVGTYGYMAPEYAMQGQFSVKSDVFSFGVLVLEIISGQRNICSRKGDSVEDLLSYAWSNWREETISNLIDPTLRGSSRPVVDIMRNIHIALVCVQENVANRPTMGAVLLMLSSHSLSLPVPQNDVNPQISLIGDYTSRMSQSSNVTKTKSIYSSGNEASITELYPR